MNAVDLILDGLEAELALERELGVRFFECDRALLAPRASSPSAPAAVTARETAAPGAPTAAPSPRVPPMAPPPAIASPAERPSPAQPARAETGCFDFVFLHDRPLSPEGEEMMAKIIAALGRTRETAPVVCDGALPAAKIYVVLGSGALKKWFPSLRAVPGQWASAGQVANILVTYSPAYILRFNLLTPAVQKIKKDMWQSLKSVLQRLRQA